MATPGGFMLEGCKAIADALGIQPRRVPALVRAGAPIRVLWRATGRRYLADRRALVRWVRNR